MDFIHRGANIGKFISAIGTLLAGGPGFLFKFFVALVGRLFIANRVRLFFVDGLFFQGSGRRESYDLLAAAATLLPEDRELPFPDLLPLEPLVSPRESLLLGVPPVKFTVPIHGS